MTSETVDLTTIDGASALASIFAARGDQGSANPTPTPAVGNPPGDQPPASGEASRETPTSKDGVDPSLDTGALSKLDLDTLLKDPTLGPKLQSWNDKSALAQVNSALERERARTQQDASAAEEAALKEYFSSLTQEDLGRVLREDPSLAASYGRLQQSKNAPDPQEVMLAAKTIAFATIVHDTTNRVTAAGLKLEGDLDPNSFTQYGDDGINRWQAAANDAIVRSQVEKMVNDEVDVRMKARIEEESAKGDDSPRLSSSGAKQVPMDLMSTPSSALLEDAFSRASRR